MRLPEMQFVHSEEWRYSFSDTKQQRKGEYLGKTVQVVPHVTDAIQDWIERVAQVPVDESGLMPDVCIVEVCSRYYLVL